MSKCKVIPAVRNFKELERALLSPSDVIFLLEGEIIHLKNIVERVKQFKKEIFIHLELIKGLKEDEASIHFLAKWIGIDGILSTRSSSLLLAKKYGLTTIQRGFLIDSQSIKTILNIASKANPDYIELLPCFAYSKVADIRKQTDADIILGGFIDDKKQLEIIFEAGAIAASTSSSHLWTIGGNCFVKTGVS